MKSRKYKLLYYIKYRDKYLKFIDQNTNINLFRCSHQAHIPVFDFKKEEKSIPSLRLTPIPFIKAKYLKNREDSDRLSQTKRTAVLMRQIEYTTKKKKKKSTKNDTINSSKGSINNKNISSISVRYPLDIVKLIQEKWRSHSSHRNEKAEIIQAVFFGYFMRKLLKEIKADYAIIEKGLNMINCVIIENFLKLKKISPCKPLLDCGYYTKQWRKSKFDFLISLQRAIKIYLHRQLLQPHPIMTKHCFIKDGTCFLSNINKIQAKAKIYCQYLHDLRKHPKNFTGSKIYRPMMKIIFIQRFIRYHINKKKIHKRIPREKATNSLFTREIKKSQSSLINEDNKLSESLDQESYSIPKLKSKNNSLQRRIKHHIPIKQGYYSKVIQPLAAIKASQKQIKKHLLRHLYTFPKIKEHSFFTKRILMKKEMNSIVNIQREVNYFIYRLNANDSIIQKQKVEPMRTTKVLVSEYKQILSQAVKVRVDYDRELLNLIVVLYLILRKQYGSYVFNKILNRRPTSIIQEDSYVDEQPDEQIEVYIPDDDCIDYSALRVDSNEDVNQNPENIIIPESQSTLKIHEKKKNNPSDDEDDDPLKSFSFKDSLNMFKSMDIKKILNFSDNNKVMSDSKPQKDACHNSAQNDGKNYSRVSIQDFMKNPIKKKGSKCIIRDLSPNHDFI